MAIDKTIKGMPMCNFKRLVRMAVTSKDSANAVETQPRKMP